MTRISDRLLVQRVDDRLILMEEHSFAEPVEIVYSLEETRLLLAAIQRLFADRLITQTEYGEPGQAIFQ